MQEVEIHADHTIIFEGKTSPPREDRISFIVQISNYPKADVNLFFREERVEIIANNYPVSSEVIEYLKKKEAPKLKEVSTEIRDEISNIHSFLSDCTTRVLSIIKYHLSYIDISEQLFAIKSRHWRIPGLDWKYLPSTLSAVIASHVIPLFDTKTCEEVQKSLNEGIFPLVGMRHLHRAKNESLPHYKWIDATIAAELAIKEVLIRAQPVLEPLINEVPSPPLTKLYGSILESYLGERSPFLKVIDNGVKIRNRLLHKPTLVMVDRQEAIEYVDNIEGAIFHLLSLLYPTNKLWKLWVERFPDFPISLEQY
jgi:hypothetical protein